MYLKTVAANLLTKAKPQFLVVNALLLSAILVIVLNDASICQTKADSDAMDRNFSFGSPSSVVEPTASSIIGPNCIQNPYIGALEESLDVIANRSKTWLDNLPALHEEAVNDKYKRHDHARFFPFETMAHCKNESVSCIGGGCRGDTSKIVCGAEQLQSGCVVYSIGGNNQWGFERDVLANTPCEVHTFDCTGDRSRFKVPENDRLHFHHVCLSDKHAKAPNGECSGNNLCGETWTLLEMQQKLGHNRIDMLKVDIEGYEWPLLQSWPEIVRDKERSDEMLLPMQIMVEVHYQTHMPMLRQQPPQEFKWASDLVELQAHLLRMGYVTITRDDNRSCRHCTELTLLRAQCPMSQTEVQAAA